MRRSDNKMAPDLPLALSASAEAAAQEYVSKGILSPYATRDSAALRREQSAQDTPSVLRPVFVRDSEKIVHAPIYNRLVGKTQVFSFRANDDLTRRGLHVQLVARISLDIGRALGLNLDLIEAIALGHDIGHTPFGHAGERFLSEVYNKYTGRYFFHNVHSVRVLDVLSHENLTLQTLDGIICHNGEFEQQKFETSGLAEFDTFDRVVESCWQNGASAIARLRPMTLEGCVVRVSDIIAYVGKDRQDAILAGICDEDSFDDGLGSDYNSWALSAFSADVVENSLGKDHIQMSEAAFAEMARAKRENWKKIYSVSETAPGIADKDAPVSILHELFSGMYERILEDLDARDENAPVFRHHIRMVNSWLEGKDAAYDWQDDPYTCAVDYIASMTDDYFMAYAKELFPKQAALLKTREHF